MEVRNKNADPDAKKNLPAVIHPNVVVSPHPLSASAGRKLFYTDFIPGESLDEYLVRNHLMPPVTDNFVISVNGKNVDFDKLDLVFPRKGDMIVIRARVHGGGDEGSNPLVIVLMIAVLVASRNPALAAQVGGWFGAGAAVGSAIIVVGGMLLISALVPANVPTFDESTPDPTYSLSGSANRTRAYEPLPVAFGVVRMYPDHAARPFTSYEENDQKLFQIFNFGLTNPTLSELKIGDAPLEDFLGIDYEISPGTTGDITLFPSNVDSLAGGDLVANAGVFIERTSSDDTTRLVIDFSGLSFFIGREEGLAEARLTLTAEYRVAGSGGAWLPFFREFAGLVSIIPLVINWTDSATTDIVNGDKEVMRLAYHRTVAQGQYEVRVKLHDLADFTYNRTTCDDEGSNCTTTRVYDPRGLNAGGMTQVLAWDQLKSYQPDLGDYSDQKRFALEIRANAQLQGRVDAFNAIASVTIPSWNGATWANAVSSNPADQFLALARGGFDSSGRRLYGAGLPDSRIDIPAIQDWADWCTAKNLECNIVMTGKMTVIDMMNTIARVGRGTATWSNGLLGIVYDEGNKSPVAMFGMANMIRNSFKVNYVSENQVDEVVVAFNNPDIGWKRDTVRVVVPGVVTPINTVTIEIPGITDEAQAAKEANLIAAEQFYRRRLMTWETDIEGLTVQRGDVATLSHDVTQWDYSGRLVAGPTTTQIQLDHEVEYGTAAYVGVRFPDGTYEINEVSSFAGPNDTLVLLTPLSAIPDNDVNNDVGDYLWFYGPTATPGKLVKITDVTPLSEDRVRIVATDEDDAFYLSESDTYTYVPPTAYTTDIPTITDLQLGESLIIVGSGFASKVNVSWNVTGEYGGAFIRAGDEDTPLKDIGRTLDQRFSFEWPTGKTVQVEVTLHNQSYEMSDVSRDTASLLLVGKMKLPADVTDFVTLQNGGVVVMKWTQVADVDLAGYDIRYGKRGASTYEDGTPLTTVTRGTNVTSADVPPGDWTIYIKAVDTSGNYSANATERDIVVVSDRDVIIQIPQSPDWLGIPGYDLLTIGDISVTDYGFFGAYFLPIDGTKTHELTFRLAKDAIGRATRFPYFQVSMTGGTTPATFTVFLDTDTGDNQSVPLNGTRTLSVVSNGDFWDVSLLFTATDTTNNLVTVTYYPARGASATWVVSQSTTGSISTSTPVLTEDGETVNILASLGMLDNWATDPTYSTVEPNTEWSFGFVKHPYGSIVPRSQDANSDDGAVLWVDDTVFEEFVVNPYPICTYVAPEIDIDFDDDVRVWGSIESQLGEGITEGIANPALSVDHRISALPYNGFESWSIGNVLGRYFKHRLTLDTAIGLAFVTEFIPTVDQLEHTLSGSGVDLLATWTTITFSHPFHNIPHVSAIAIASDAKHAVIDNVSAVSFDVAVFNSGGTLVTGTINWEARGI